MGVNNMTQKCLTCGENKECPGHFGRMKLEEPVYHYGYLKFVEKVIKCICLKCSRLRKPKDNVLLFLT
jgi:DNA-directed RNA polymerase II subunit RPB1